MHDGMLGSSHLHSTRPFWLQKLLQHIGPILANKSQDAMHPGVEIPVVYAIGFIRLAVKRSIAVETSIVSRCACKAKHQLLIVFKPV